MNRDFGKKPFCNIKVLSKISEGGYATVYRCLDMSLDKQIALKVIKDKRSRALLREMKFYEALSKSNLESYQEVALFRHPTTMEALIRLPLLGPDLSTIPSESLVSEDFKLLKLLAVEAIARLQEIHSNGIIHCDLKPENFCLLNSSPGCTSLRLIDFNISENYLVENDNGEMVHREFKEGKGFSGNRRFASANAHKGLSQSRRDDLESLCYVLVSLGQKKLPWQGIKNMNINDLHKELAEVKSLTSAKQLCKGLPEAFETFTVYAKSLEFDAEPDYETLKELFKQ